ncbi:MAG: HAMP domain-containing protein [Alphaproteobacteria bacterium]|nr:HAMP domain-containing protein [Alphaproteobacteria bacterium]
MQPFAIHHSIGAKLLAAFFAMAMIVGALGGYSYWLLSSAGNLVVRTYDGPLMAINFARAASLDFALMQKDVLRAQLAPPSERAAITQDLSNLTSTFFADLKVAMDRSSADDERGEIRAIKNLVTQWVAAHRDLAEPVIDARYQALDHAILGHFDMLIEYNADHSFVGRRKAVWAIARYQYAIGIGTGLALLLACAIAFLLSRRIVQPLSVASSVAERIASGELETPIPTGGKDETGLLLKSMRVMQVSIRKMMQHEKALRASAEIRLIEALEGSTDGVVVSGPKGNVVVANSQLGTFFPLTAGNVTSGSDYGDALDVVEVELRPDADGRALRTQLAAEAAGSVAIERQLMDGRWLRFNASRTSDGGAILLISDFSQIKKREEKLKLAKLAAEEASAAKSRFLATMSHELRTPLNAIIGFSEIMSGELFGPIQNRRYAEFTSDILSSGRHLLEVINGVLELARSDAGKMELHAEELDLRDVISDCAKLMGEQCRNAGLDFACGEPTEALPVTGEPAKLRQIFLNLLSNAMKFTEPGGRVSVAVEEDAETITVQVRDSGIGMSEADIAVALTPFGQVDSRLERRYEGTGLGLPLTKAFVELHGGTLTIQSKPGAGTTVSVRLMRRQAMHSAEQEFRRTPRARSA